VSLDPSVAADLLTPEGPPVGSHTAGRTMGESSPPGVAGPSTGIYVDSAGAGNSLAPADGPHEPSPVVAGAEWGVNRSQTAAASDPGTDIRQSNGEVAVPTPGHVSGLPLEWADSAMANSQPGWTFNPTLYVPGLGARNLYHVGNPRTARPGPQSQGMADTFAPAPGAPLGTRYARETARGEGFVGRTVTKARARKILGPRKPRHRAFPKLPRGRR
jgi:hypothetical protein